MISTCELNDNEIYDLYFVCASKMCRKLNDMNVKYPYINGSLFEIFIKILSNNNYKDIIDYSKYNVIFEEMINKIVKCIDNFQALMRLDDTSLLDGYFNKGGLDYILIICLSFENRTALVGARDFYGVRAIFLDVADKVNKLNESMSNLSSTSKYEEYIKYVKDSLILGMSSMSQYSIDDVSKRPKGYQEIIGVGFEYLDEIRKNELNQSFGVNADKIIKDNKFF